MRQQLASQILQDSLLLKEQLASLARLSNIVYNFKKSPDSTDLERDFFPFSLLPLEVSYRKIIQLKKQQLDELRTCQLSIQKLFLKASEDPEFVNKIFEQTAKNDKFVARLLNLYNETFERANAQKIRCNVIRSDYMKDGPDGEWSLIEFNAMSAGSATTCERLQTMNSFLSETVLKQHYDKLKENGLKVLSELRYRDTLEVPIQAWKQYGNPNAIILMVFEGLRQNIADEKEVETVFVGAGIRTVEADFNTMHSRLRLDEQNKLFYGDDEVGLVHYRAGYNPDHYLHETTWDARKTIQLSQAVKFPNVGMQLINFKRAQPDLCSKEVLEKYLSKEQVEPMLKHFVKIWNFDGSVEEQEQLVELCRAHPQLYVLKPNLEAGGNNIYNQKIVEVLEKSSPEERKNYILMKKIRPWLNHTVMFRRKSVACSDVITELGIFGGILAIDGQIKLNVTGGNLLKSKVPTSEDGGVVVGHAVFDAIMIAA